MQDAHKEACICLGLSWKASCRTSLVPKSPGDFFSSGVWSCWLPRGSLHPAHLINHAWQGSGIHTTMSLTERQTKVWKDWPDVAQAALFSWQEQISEPSLLYANMWLCLMGNCSVWATVIETWTLIFLSLVPAENKKRSDLIKIIFCFN